LSESGYYSLDWKNQFSIQESCFDPIPLSESFPLLIDPLYTSLDIEPNPITTIQDDFFCGYGNEVGVWNELGVLFEPHRPALMLCNNGETGEEPKEERKAKRCREDKSFGSKMLTRKTISQYFYMPITQAAKELNVGLTVLKKRCRELGIRRWPHRKLMSLQTLIKNVQELGKEEGEGSEGKMREAIEILEKERRYIEEIPDMELEDKTRRLRQACFKANYKKRKLMGMMDSQSSSSAIACETGNIEEEDDEIKSLLCDSFSSSKMLLEF
ncbi:RWP-RK domain-containing protein, partial [Cephalotus follicularis]